MMTMSGNFTVESQMSSCDEPRGIGCWNLWGFMACTQAPRQEKATQEYRRWQEREGPDSKRVSRIIDQAALTLLPKGFAETVLKLWLLHAHIWSKCFKSTAIRKEKSECPDKFYSRKWRCKTLPYTTPKKDQRSVCLGHKYGTVSEQDFRENEKRKEESKQKRNHDKQEAEGNDNIMVLTIDL